MHIDLAGVELERLGLQLLKGAAERSRVDAGPDGLDGIDIERREG